MAKYWNEVRYTQPTVDELKRRSSEAIAREKRNCILLSYKGEISQKIGGE